MAYFDKDYLDFFSELEKNNSKEWFDENRKRYEKSIKRPFKVFMQALAKELSPLYPNADLANNTSIMRINRDIRFSADKTPYKIHMAGMVMPHGKQDKTKPGFFVQANHNDIRVYSGAHMLEKEDLLAVREHIADNLNEFNKLITDKNFVTTFGEIKGEKNKRLTGELKEAGEKQPLIYNKNFYWFFKLKPSTIVKDNLIKELVTNYKHALPLNQFFEEALGV